MLKRRKSSAPFPLPALSITVSNSVWSFGSFACWFDSVTQQKSFLSSFCHDRELSWGTEVSGRTITSEVAGGHRQEKALWGRHCVCVPLGEVLLDGWLPSSHGYLKEFYLEHFSLATSFLTTHFQSDSWKMRLLQQPDPSHVAWMGCNRGGWVSLDSTGIRLNFRPLFEQSLKFFTALAAPSSIFPITASVRGSA